MDKSAGPRVLSRAGLAPRSREDRSKRTTGGRVETPPPSPQQAFLDRFVRDTVVTAPPSAFRGTAFQWRLNSRHDVDDEDMDRLLDLHPTLSGAQRSAVMSRVKRFPEPRLAPKLLALWPRVPRGGRDISEFSSAVLVVATRLRKKPASPHAEHLAALHDTVVQAESAKIELSGMHMNEAAWMAATKRLERVKRRGAGREADWRGLRTLAIAVLQSLHDPQPLYRGGVGVILACELVPDLAVCEELLACLRAWADIGPLIERRTLGKRRDLAALHRAFFLVLVRGSKAQAHALAAWLLGPGLQDRRDAQLAAKLEFFARTSRSALRDRGVEDAVLEGIARRYGFWEEIEK